MTREFLERHGRSLVAATAATFSVSIAFPVWAALTPAGQVIAWIGLIDVGIALALIVASLGLVARTAGRVSNAAIQASYLFYRCVASSVPLFLLCLFFLCGDCVRWSVLLPGLAWRFWLLCYVLPVAITVWREGGRMRVAT